MNWLNWKMIAAVVVVCVALLGGGVFFIQTTILNDYESYIKNIVADDPTIKINIAGNIKFQVFPCSFVFHDVSIKYHEQYLLRAKIMRIPVSILRRVIQHKIDHVDEVVFDTGTINVKALQQFYEQYKENLGKKLQSQKLVFHNFNYTDEKRTKIVHTPQAVVQNGVIISNSDQTYNYKMEFLACNTILKLDGTINQSDKQHTKIYGKLTSKYFDISLNEDDDTTTGNEGKSKNLSFNVYDLHAFYNAFVSQHGEGRKEATSVNARYGTTNKDDMNINQQEGEGKIPLQLTANLKISPHSIALSDIQILSDVVQGFKGYLSVQILNDDIMYYMKLNAKQITMPDTSGALNVVHYFKEKMSFISHNNFDITSLHNISGKAQIRINNITSGKNSIMRDIVVDAINLPQAMYFSKFQIVMPQDTKLYGNATLYNTYMMPRFESDVRLETKNLEKFIHIMDEKLQNVSFAKAPIRNFTLSTNVLAMPYHISFSNAKLQVDDAYHITGSAQLMHQMVSIFVNGDFMDFDNLGFTSYYENYLQALYHSDWDITGETYFDKTNDHRWLRSLKNNISLNLSFNKILFKDTQLRDFYSDISLSPSKLRVNVLKFDSDFIAPEIRLYFTIPLFRPYLDTTINIKNMDLERFSKFLPNFENRSNNEHTKEMNFFSAVDYDGKVLANANAIKCSNETSLNDVILNASLDNGKFAINNLQYNVYDGKVKMLADIALNTGIPQIDMTFSVTNIDQKQLFRSLFGVDKLSGYINLAGVLAATGKTADGIIYTANAKVDFLCKDVKFTGMDLEKIIETTDDLDGVVHNKVAIMKYYSQYGETFFDSIKGVMAIQGGIARVRDTELYNARLSGAYLANIDLMRLNLKSILQISFVPIGYYNSTLGIKISSNGNIKSTKTDFDFQEVYNYIRYDPKKDESDDEKMRQSKIPLRATIIAVMRALSMNKALTGTVPSS